MCDICRQIPCDARCPNSLEFEPLIKCKTCKSILYGGERYLQTSSGCICGGWLEGFTMWDWLEAFNKDLEEV